MSHPLTMIDLFAGCGGLSLGLEQAGFEPLLVNELSPDALETYLENRRLENPLLDKYKVNDVKKLVLDDALRDDLFEGMKKDYKLKRKKNEGLGVDLLVGGPPCQGYSGIGHRRSYSVDRRQLPSNHLYEDMAFLIAQVRPKLFLFENVKGLISARWTKEGEKGEIWNDVKKKFGAIPGYHAHPQLVYAKDYGVPQNRPRVLIVGVREDVDVSSFLDTSKVGDGLLPEPTRDYPSPIELLGDILDPAYVNGGDTKRYPHSIHSEIQRYLRTSKDGKRTFRKGDPLTEHEYSNHSPHIVKKFKHMLAHGGKIPPSMQTKKFAQRVLGEQWPEGGPNITATSLPDDYVHFAQPRSLTVREWARLQMFPDWYQFAGKRTTGGIRRAGNPRQGIHDREVPKYTQIGNAVPVKLAREIGLHFRKILTK